MVKQRFRKSWAIIIGIALTATGFFVLPHTISLAQNIVDSNHSKVIKKDTLESLPNLIQVNENTDFKGLNVIVAKESAQSEAEDISCNEASEKAIGLVEKLFDMNITDCTAIAYYMPSADSLLKSSLWKINLILPNNLAFICDVYSATGVVDSISKQRATDLESNLSGSVTSTESYNGVPSATSIPSEPDKVDMLLESAHELDYLLQKANAYAKDEQSINKATNLIETHLLNGRTISSTTCSGVMVDSEDNQSVSYEITMSDKSSYGLEYNSAEDKLITFIFFPEGKHNY